MKTYSAKAEDIERAWHLIDLDGATVGRAASQIAQLVRGKHKPTFTPHVDCGDFVVCINAEGLVLSGKKETDKMYRKHSSYPGGLKEISAGELLEKSPEDLIRYAVQGMLPKNKLAEKMLAKLKVYAGPEHPHQAQQPESYELD